MAKKAIKKDVNTKDVKTAATYKELDTLILVTIGTADRPAGPEDITDAKEILKDKDLSVLITHYAFNITLIENIKNSFVLFNLGDFDNVATDSDIEAFKAEYEEAIKERRPIVWNHAVRVATYPKSAFNKD